MKFAPLHIISGYSFLQSGLTIDKIATSVKAYDYYGAGLSDVNVLYGVPSFYLALEKLNKKSIIGMQINIDGFLLCLYAKNEEGYRQLTKISTSIAKEEFDANSINKVGLIGVLDTHNSSIYESFKTGELSIDDNRKVASLSSLCEEFYIGIEISSKEDREIAKNIRSWAENHTYPLVAFPRIKYVKSEDAIVLKITDAIANDKIISEKTFEGNEHFFSEENYLKIYTKTEIENTVKIVDSSSFNFHQKRGELLHFDESVDSTTLLKEMVFDGLKALNLDSDETYINRVNYELDVICSMGYANYFLVVQDYIKFAKNNNILVGPGRGSAAGSLVAYLLNITEIDPIKYRLQFERFLNPARQTMPDIDVDFMDTRRDEVVEYCRQKYGAKRVSNIITFQTILAKQALRDIGRIYDIPTRHIDLLSKNLTNKSYSLRESYKYLPNFKKLIDSDKYFLEIVSLASKIEGLPRQSGVHAAGVILNNEPIEEAMPISVDLANNYISQYEMSYLEEQGFLKMDFLGLTNLSIISRCVDLINTNHPEANLDKKHVPFEDPKVFELIASGKTMGVFQLESSGMKKAIREIKPNCFEDIVAIIALFRPGPMKNIPTYAKRKQGLEKVNYISKDLEKTLAPTYGIIVYQEQVNEIATVMAGFSMSEADVFRRAISKKKSDVLSSLEKSFIQGCLKNNYTYKESKTVFDSIARFADYGFNRSHAVVYSYIACQMAWLKTYYPLEFYAAILENSSATNDIKFSEYVSEMKARNFDILSPDINKSQLVFSIYEGGLLFPLGAIKGINEVVANKIIYERNLNGEFSDFFDFVIRMYAYKLSELQLTKLIDAGCFDKLHPSRETLRRSILTANQYANLCYDEKGSVLLDLNIGKPLLINENDDPLENLDKEYQTLGIMLSDNPLRYKKDLLVVQNVSPILEAGENKEFKVAGILKTKKTINTKKGTTMAFVKIFDETGELELTIFPELYQESILLLEKNKILLVEGKAETSKDETTFIAEKISLLGE